MSNEKFGNRPPEMRKHIRGRKPKKSEEETAAALEKGAAAAKAIGAEAGADPESATGAENALLFHQWKKDGEADEDKG